VAMTTTSKPRMESFLNVGGIPSKSLLKKNAFSDNFQPQIHKF
jgi:hypothetical protein